MSSEIATRLSRETQNLVSKFEGRLGSFAQREDLLALLKTLDDHDADAFAREYFGRGEHTAVGIDGSMDYDEKMQMMLFYSNATAYACPFTVDGTTSFELARVSRGRKLSASAAVPLWTEDLSDVLGEALDIQLELEHSMDRIPNAFMTLAELYLALKSSEDARVIFLDRPLSGTYSTLLQDGRFLARRMSSNLYRLSGRSHEETLLDLVLSTRIGSPSMWLPTRPKFLQARIIRLLIEGERSQAELAVDLGVDSKRLARSLRSLREFDRRHGGALLENSEGGRLRLRERVRGYWERSVALASGYCSGVYEEGRSPLSVGEEEWLTVLDVSAVSLILFQHLWEICARSRCLLVGIAKDTTATEISRSVLPFAVEDGSVKLKREAPKLRNDRAFLSILSSENRGMKPPWRTGGYDACFSTVVSLPAGDGPRFRSARKAVSRERLFVRGFFQSRSMGREGRVRSPVFLYDRLYDERYDSQGLKGLSVMEDFVPVEITPYFEDGGASRLSNLVLRILAMSDNPEVYEAFGHNQLLYLADKAVKAEIRLMKSSLRAVVDLRMGISVRREEVYGIATTYREQRSGVEAARMRNASEGS